MRVAVLTDIHANAAALEAVLAAVGHVDGVWVLGDVVGYGPQPDMVVDRLRSIGAVAVQGNHDAAVLGRIPVDAFNEAARLAVQWTIRTITPETRAWLAALPDKRIIGDFTLVHGSPREPLWEYVFSAPVARANLGEFGTPYCLVGHTHVPVVFREERDHVLQLPAEPGDRLVLDARRCMLNPGGVGQPRDGDPRACAMLLDDERREATWLRVEYPVMETQAAMRTLPLPPWLASRLAMGR